MKKIIFLILIFTLFSTIVHAEDFTPQFERAHTLFKWKYYDHAISKLDKIIGSRREPHVSRAKFLKAVCYLRKNDPKTATNVFQTLIDSKYILTEYVLYYLGNYYLDAGMFDLAQQHFNIINSRFPNSALFGISKLKEAKCFYKMKDYNSASKLYKEYADSYTSGDDIDEAYYNLGRCYEKTGQIKPAIGTYNKIALYHPLSKKTAAAKKRIKYLSRKYGIYPKKETAQILFNKGMVFYKKQDFNSAAYYFYKVIKSHRKASIYDKALFNLALCNYKRRKLKTATTRFNICVNRGSKYADDAQFYVAFAYGKRGYFYKALNALKKVISKYPDSQYRDDALYYLGYYYEINNFKTSALKYYEKLAAEFPESNYADDALWKIGKMHYFKGNYQKAFNSFDQVVGQNEAGNMSDECAYWKALTLQKMGKKFEAVFAYRHVVERFDHTYYSNRARAKLRSLGIRMDEFDSQNIRIADLDLGKDFFEASPYKVDLSGEREPLPIEDIYVDVEPSKAEKKEKSFVVIDLKKHFKKYSELMSMNLFDEAKIEAEWLIAGAPSYKKESARLALSAAYLGNGNYRKAIILAEGICNTSVVKGDFREIPKISWYLSYPKGYYGHVKKYSEKYGLDPLLVLAVIREESRFNPRTLSWARAHGLMQIIPTTGRDIARSLRIRPFYNRKMYDPETNIKMGCYYLAKLIKKFNGSKMFALAGYNGGPRNVQKWINRWKRKNGSEINIDEFAENIPLKETRRYVQKVLKSYNEYKRIYNDKNINLTDFMQYYE